MTTLYSRVIKTDAEVNNHDSYHCEARHCACRRDVEPVDGPGGIVLTLCPSHRSKLLGGEANA